jgi:hypothetical protein
VGKTHQSITINAPVDEGWKALRNFHDMSWAPNVITDLKVVGQTAADQVGTSRVLNGAFRETLLELNEDQKTFSYSIDDGGRGRALHHGEPEV